MRRARFHALSVLAFAFALTAASVWSRRTVPDSYEPRIETPHERARARFRF